MKLVVINVVLIIWYHCTSKQDTAIVDDGLSLYQEPILKKHSSVEFDPTLEV